MPQAFWKCSERSRRGSPTGTSGVLGHAVEHERAVDAADREQAGDVEPVEREARSTRARSSASRTSRCRRSASTRRMAAPICRRPRLRLKLREMSQKNGTTKWTTRTAMLIFAHGPKSQRLWYQVVSSGSAAYQISMNWREPDVRPEDDEAEHQLPEVVVVLRRDGALERARAAQRHRHDDHDREARDDAGGEVVDAEDGREPASARATSPSRTRRT